MKTQLIGLIGQVFEWISKLIGKTVPILVRLAVIVAVLAVISYWLMANAENLVFTATHPTQVKELSAAYAKYHSEADKKLTETYARSYLSPVPQ